MGNNADIMRGLEGQIVTLRQRAEAAEQRVTELLDTVYRLRNPKALDQERDKFIRDVGPTEPCECGHTAEHHDVRLNERGEYERYCTRCNCDEFAAALAPTPAGEATA